MANNKDLVTALQKLLQETIERIDPKIDKAILAKHIRDLLSDVKITKDNLDPELLMELAIKRTIQTVPTITPTGKKVVKELGEISPDEPVKQKIIDDLLLGNNVWLHGAAGTGKTYMAKEAARILGRKFISIPCNQYTSPSVFLGGQTIDGYREGKLIRAWVKGYVLILDEITKLDPNTAGALNEALAGIDDPDPIIGSNEVDKDGEPLQYRMHPDFCVIATSNTTGKGVSAVYGGNFQQDLSLLDRFSANFYEISFNDKRDRTLISPITFELCVGIRKVLLDTKAEEIMTLRTMIHLDKIYNLEMQRILKIGGAEQVPNGKTFKDSVDSLLNTMETDTSDRVKNIGNFRILADQDIPEEKKQADDEGYIRVNISAFINSYRRADIYERYLKSKISRTVEEDNYLELHGLI